MTRRTAKTFERGEAVEIGDGRACAQVDIALRECQRAAFTKLDYAWLAVVAASKAITRRGEAIAEIASILETEIDRDTVPSRRIRKRIK